MQIKFGDSEKFVNIPKDGETRFCLDPWTKVFIKTNGDVALCCNAGPIGSIKIDKLEDILNNNEAIKYREGLINCSLPHACKICSDRKTVKQEELVEIVHKYLNSNDFETIEYIEKNQ